MNFPLNPLPKVANGDGRLSSTVFEDGRSAAMVGETFREGPLLVWRLQAGNLQRVPHRELPFVECLLS